MLYAKIHTVKLWFKACTIFFYMLDPCAAFIILHRSLGLHISPEDYNSLLICNFEF